MSRLLNQALDALLTDPVTKEPLSNADLSSIGIGMGVAVVVIVSMIAIFMAVEP